MDDEIPPIQPVAPTPAVPRLRPVADFRRRLGLKLQLIALRARNAAVRRGPPVPREEVAPEDPPEDDPPPGHIDAKA